MKAVKNLNLLDANQLAIHKYIWEVEPGTARIKFNKWEQVLNPGKQDIHWASLPPMFVTIHFFTALQMPWQQRNGKRKFWNMKTT